MASGRQSERRLLLIAIAALILYLPGLGRPALWEPDEGRYAEIAREMYLTGDFVTPRDDFVRYFEKPPLVYWAESASIALFGIDEFAIRLPAALFSVGQVVVTAAIAAAMFGDAVAILAAIALALSPLFFGFARFATLDPALAFFMTAGLGAFLMASRAEDFGVGVGRRWFLGCAAMLAFGTLAKGPVAPVLCGAVALIWMIMERRTREIVHIPWIPAIAVYLVIAVPWFAIAAYRNPDFLGFFFIHEHVHRFLEDTEHGWGLWFFIPIVIGGAWPWIYFVPMGVRVSSADESRRSAMRFLIIWFLVIFVFFSIPRAKLGSYILPAMPALAILAALGIYRLWDIEARAASRIISGFALLTLLGAFAAAVAAVMVRNKMPPALSRDAFLIAAILAALGIAAFMVDRKGDRPGALVMTLALGVLVLMGVASRARNDAADLTSYRKLAKEAADHLHPGCVLGSYRHIVQSLPFYTGFREALVSYRGELAPFSDDPDAAESFIHNDDELRRRWSSNRCFMLIANRKDLPALATLTPAPVIVGCEGKKLALLNDPNAPRDASCGP